MEFRPVTHKDYSQLLELDKKVYPTDEPVTSAILDQWYQRNPEFGLVNEQGMCIAIPLSSNGWIRLTQGELAEADLDSNLIFDSERDSELGIHIYHIEKFGGERFYEHSLRGLQKIVAKLDVSVIGFSGLCVTAEGIGLFSQKFNCQEQKYHCQEHILSKGGRLIIAESEDEANHKVKEGYTLQNRCKMLVTNPKEQSIVWDYLGNNN